MARYLAWTNGKYYYEPETDRNLYGTSGFQFDF